MPSSMYNNSIPAFIRSLNNLSAILTKAETWAAGKKIDQGVLINLRLAADMLPFSKQIQIASDGVKAFAARVAGVEIPSFADTEASLPELQERIAKTIKFLQSFKPEQIDGAETKEIRFKTGSGANERVFNGLDYLNLFVIPNYYFHVTTAYAILRHNGLEIGKGDYLGSF